MINSSHDIILSSVKKLKLILLIFLIFFSCSHPASAYEQTQAVCYSQCAAYKFYWKGDSCWDFFSMNCGVSKTAFASKVVSMLKEASKTGAGSPAAALSAVTKALMCGAVANECIAPKLDACQSTCQISPKTYAPNLVADGGWNSAPGVSYDRFQQKLYFRVGNTGAGYAWNIPVKAEWGSTADRDGEINSYQTLFEDTADELLFMGSRQSAPKGAVDTIKDFLIDESNFSNYLSKFKSDAGQEYIPPVWLKEIEFEPPAGELTVVRLYVDPDDEIPETTEADNVYVYEFDDRPEPAKFVVTEAEIELLDQDLTKRKIKAEIENRGEEEGEVVVEVYTEEKGTFGQLIKQETFDLSGGETIDWSTQIPLNFKDDYCIWRKQLYVKVTGPEGGTHSRAVYTRGFQANISGFIKNEAGEDLVGAKVETSLGHTAKTDRRGRYLIKGIRQLGPLTVTASHDDYEINVSEEAEISIADPDNTLCNDEGLSKRVDFVLSNNPAQIALNIIDQQGNKIDSAQILAINSDYRQEIDENTASLDIGTYTFRVSAPGYFPLEKEVKLKSGSQTLGFTLTQFVRRTSDEGFKLLKPKMLWEKDLNLGDRYFIERYAASKDGSLLVVYTVDTAEDDLGKLFFIDPQSGKTIKEVRPGNSGGNPGLSLDVSWDGETVFWYTSILADYSGDPNRRTVLKLYNQTGEEFLSKDFKPGGAEGYDMSPDGYYVHPGRLANRSGYVYTRWDTRGKENSSLEEKFIPVQHFLTDNTIVARCEDELQSHCRYDLHKNLMQTFADIGKVVAIDSSADGRTVAIQSTKKIYLYQDGQLVWEKDSNNRRNPIVSVSPGGQYVAVMAKHSSSDDQALTIFNLKGDNLIAEEDMSYTDFVTFNEKGVFYVKQPSGRGKIQYYQLASYPPMKQSAVETKNKAGTKTKKTVAAVGCVGLAGTGLYLAQKNLNLGKILEIIKNKGS